MTLMLSPALWWARLNLHGLIGFAVLVGVAVDLLPKLLRELLAIVSVVVSLAGLYPLSSAWGVTPQVAFQLAVLSPEERAVFQLSPQLPPTAMARARERELSKGTVVAFVAPYDFPAVLWNERFDNEVDYVAQRGGPSFMNRLAKLHARWAVVPSKSPQEKALRRYGKNLWQQAGMISPRQVVYRRFGN